MPKLRIPGTPDAVPVRPVLADTVDGITERESVNVGSGRSGAALVDIDGSFIELELGSGVRLWGRTEDVAARWHRGAGRGGDGIPELPVVLPIGRASRDVGSGLTVVAARTFELTASALLTDWIVEKVETGKAEGGELRQCATPDLFALSAPAPMQGTAPVLVFIHGTASSTEGSFGGLWQAGAIGGVLGLRNVGAQIRSLFRHYGGRVLAFEHRSLTDSPVANALALVEQLSSVVPTGTELHLVSHSRGGLIGELLCRGMREDGVSFDAHDLRLFADDGRKKDLMALQALGNALQEQETEADDQEKLDGPANETAGIGGHLAANIGTHEEWPAGEGEVETDRQQEESDADNIDPEPRPIAHRAIDQVDAHMLVHLERIGRSQKHDAGKHVPLDLKPAIRAVREKVADDRIACADQRAKQDQIIGDLAKLFGNGVDDAAQG